jgi:hypothetical protein
MADSASAAARLPSLRLTENANLSFPPSISMRGPFRCRSLGEDFAGKREAFEERSHLGHAVV